MPPGKNSLSVGADLIGDFTGATQRAIAAHNHQVDLSALHQVAGGVVGDDLVGDSLLCKFPCRERCALGTRPGLVAVNMKLPSARLCGVKGRGSAADIHKGQPARVAMREHVHPVANQLRAVPTDVLAMTRIFVGEFLRRGQRQRLLLLDRLAGAHGLSHVIDGVDRINSGRPRGFESLAHHFDVPKEFHEVPSTESARALSKAVGRGGANRARSAHNHVFDGPRGLVEVACREDVELVRQESLLNEQNRIAPDIKRHGAKMAGAPVDGDVQTISTFIFRILLSMPRKSGCWRSGRRSGSLASHLKSQ